MARSRARLSGGALTLTSQDGAAITQSDEPPCCAAVLVRSPSRRVLYELPWSTTARSMRQDEPEFTYRLEGDHASHIGRLIVRGS